MKLLKSEINYLPGRNEISFKNHNLLGKDITDIIGKSKINFDKNTTFLLMSPTCEVCHEKLDKILKGKKYKKEELLFFADSINKIKYEEMIAKYKEIHIHPLSIYQIQNLNKGLFPIFINVAPSGKVLRVYVK